MNNPVSFLSRHNVGLLFKNERGQLQKIATAFLYEVDGQAMLITAGHVFRDMHPDYAVELIDYAGPNPRVFATTPMRFGPDSVFINDNEASDFAVIRLSDFFKASLTANGVVPLTIAQIEANRDRAFDTFCMAGFTGSDDAALNRFIKARAIKATVCEDLPSSIDAPPEGWFIGRIVVDSSIRGMSGGPIFGFSRDVDGHISYKVVAIQSGWFPEAKIITGFRLFDLANVIHDTLSFPQGMES